MRGQTIGIALLLATTPAWAEEWNTEGALEIAPMDSGISDELAEKLDMARDSLQTSVSSPEPEPQPEYMGEIAPESDAPMDVTPMDAPPRIWATPEVAPYEELTIRPSNSELAPNWAEYPEAPPQGEIE